MPPGYYRLPARHTIFKMSTGDRHMKFSVPVLTYHGVHVDGGDYGNNDHIALAADLELIQQLGWTVIPAARLAAVLTGRDDTTLPERSLVLTFDDGSWFDWHDLIHPDFGAQRGLAGILRDFRDRHGAAQPHLHATSFVIASPEARDTLDRTCLIGKGWWTDEWWPEAQREGLVGIANHSWDHRHSVIPPEQRYGEDYGHFRTVQGDGECDFQVRQSAQYLHECMGVPPEPVFAYPYGDVPTYLAEHYLPAYGEALGLMAAFAADPAPVTEAGSRWRLPRFVFRRDWSAPEHLSALLADCK